MAQAVPDLVSGIPAETDPRVFSATDAIDATTVGQLRERLLRHLDTNGPWIAIDLGGVDFIDSTGLGLLVTLLRAARDRGGDVQLLRPSRQVRRVFQITGLERIFEIDPGVS